MKKIICSLILLACVIGLISCGMKECKCLSNNIITEDGIIIDNTTDTVNNFTRGDCEEFNMEEEMALDTNIFIRNIVTCVEE